MIQTTTPRRSVKLRVRNYNTKPVQKRRGYSGVNRAKRGFQPKAINEYQNRGENTLKIIPLGGQEEVGRNMTIFEYGKDIVILDMGMQFPEEDMPGIDYIIPNIAYLQGKEKNIRAVVFSHGHLDHIGAAPILLDKLNYPPIIGRDLTIALIKKRLEDYAKDSAKRLEIIPIKSVQDKIRLGNFNLSFFDVEHSIMDAVGVILQTPSATVLHPGDWTMDKDPISGQVLSYEHLSRLPSPKILMLEGLGAIDTRPNHTTEKEMYASLEKLIRVATGKVIIGTFSSQIRRVGHILEYARTIGKKVALDGFSMKMNVEIAKELGYIKIDRDTLITVNDLHKYPDNKIIVICTGAQGEGNAVLSRIVAGDHRSIKVRKQDTIIFSSSVIPGNERTIQRLKDNLYRQCDNVIHSDIMDVHTSGHCNAQNIKEIIQQIKPDFFLPTYANHYMLKEAGKLAMGVGMHKANVFILDNGSVLEISKQGEPKLHAEKVPTSYVFVDGLGIGDIGQVVLRDRQAMAQDGMFVVIVTLDKQTGQVRNSPDIISRGFIYMRESKELLYQVRQKVKDIVHRATGSKGQFDEDYVKDQIRDKIGQFLYTKTERRPMVLPVLIEV
ncbi:ribonuclease J [Patescibacteria group bacterium]|nr:ribonuclease J [Patescibacteria group bacterium]MBU2219801.1 ribonuclease J [Patescibacteria group bacterium]MBU2265238.1 ribonuclease J [Patescibacteria group bacterium]